MLVGMDRFGLGRGPKQLRYAVQEFVFGAFSKGQISAVCLGFASESFFKILFGFRHNFFLPSYAACMVKDGLRKTFAR
jgi:hypothetical protein